MDDAVLATEVMAEVADVFFREIVLHSLHTALDQPVSGML